MCKLIRRRGVGLWSLPMSGSSLPISLYVYIYIHYSVKFRKNSMLKGEGGLSRQPSQTIEALPQTSMNLQMATNMSNPRNEHPLRFTLLPMIHLLAYPLPSHILGKNRDTQGTRPWVPSSSSCLLLLSPPLFSIMLISDDPPFLAQTKAFSFQ